MYTSGIYNDETASSPCGNDPSALDHAVTAVGYGVEKGEAYYLVRNSWGSAWGDQGYIKMLASGYGNGTCGIQLDSAYCVTN